MLVQISSFIFICFVVKGPQIFGFILIQYKCNSDSTLGKNDDVRYIFLVHSLHSRPDDFGLEGEGLS